ncbi:MAG: DUF1732 domain-containing protein [Robiginitomaculum sp.]
MKSMTGYGSAKGSYDDTNWVWEVRAVKADAPEGLDRLDAYIKQAKILLKQSPPIKLKLNFLSQKNIREFNMLCCKSTDIALTRIGLKMKSLIEQCREQAANVE